MQCNFFSSRNFTAEGESEPAGETFVAESLIAEISIAESLVAEDKGFAHIFVEKQLWTQVEK